MKKSITALALALALAGTLTACGTDRNTSGNNSGTNSGVNSGTNSGTNSGSAAGNGSGASAGQVGRRYNTAMDRGRTYLDDGQYAADSNGRVYGGGQDTLSRDLTRGARDIVRGTEDVLDDVGRGIGNAARDITGSGNYSGTPSWEPDSSAVRY